MDPKATHVVVHALNQWMHEHWTFNYEGRIFPTPVITLPIVSEAIKELEWVYERGAKIVLIRPAPVPGYEGNRSFALPEFDPFWQRVTELDITVGLHASDDGLTRYYNQWEGKPEGEHLPFAGKSAFMDIMHTQGRGIFDTVASLIGHGLLTRFPTLRMLPVENGSAWVRPFIDAIGQSYAHEPALYDEDPLMVLKRNIWIHPFHEEDPRGLCSFFFFYSFSYVLLGFRSCTTRQSRAGWRGLSSCARGVCSIRPGLGSRASVDALCTTP